MPADLKTIYDHPANVIRDWLVELPTSHAERPGGIRAAEVLRSHEAEEDVTFAALDNKTLTAVREAYERQTNAEGMEAYDAAVDLVSAVRDLLGLDD